MSTASAPQLTVELHREWRRSRREPERERVTVELHRPAAALPARRAAPDRTIELADIEIEVLPAPWPQAAPPGECWSLDHVVADDGCVAGPADDAEERRGLLWRVLFRLGWIRLEADVRPLGR